MTREEKYSHLLNLTWRAHIHEVARKQGERLESAESYSRYFWQELAFEKADLIEWVQSNGLPKKNETAGLRLGLGLDYYYKAGKWVVVFYERGGPVGSESTDDPVKVVELLIRHDFPNPPR